MKVNGNRKNSSHIDSQESATDKLSKNAVNAVDKVPVKNFDAAKTWEKLSNRLGKVDKKFVTWGLAMAASFSLLVAANIEVIDWRGLMNTQEEAQTTKLNIVEKKTVSSTTNDPIAKISIEPIQPSKTRHVTSSTSIKPFPVQQQVKKVAQFRSNNQRRTLEVTPLSNPFVSGFVKANLQSEGIAPELGLDFKLGENYTANRREIYKLGVSSQFNFKTTEEGQRKIHPHTFVNLEYTSLNKKTNKGWTSRAGYLLNPDGKLFQDTTIKVSLFRNIGKHLKIGPEVIFTDNLKKAYPSISLVLG